MTSDVRFGPKADISVKTRPLIPERTAFRLWRALTRNAMFRAVGIASCNTSSRLATNSGLIMLTPVMLPVGLLRLETVLILSVDGFLRRKSHVRFTPESGHWRCTNQYLLRANSGHPRPNKFRLRSPRNRGDVRSARIAARL
jgi:hypothetical protein